MSGNQLIGKVTIVDMTQNLSVSQCYPAFISYLFTSIAAEHVQNKEEAIIFREVDNQSKTGI